MAPLHITIDQVHSLADGHDTHPNVRARSTCYFGHEAYVTRRQRLLPQWRGAPFDALLCLTCCSTLQREHNADGVNVNWLANAPPPTAYVPRTGPCVRGHKTSSSQGSSGRQAWHAMPTGLSWEGVLHGSTLCQACYVKAWRLGTPAPPSRDVSS